MNGHTKGPWNIHDELTCCVTFTAADGVQENLFTADPEGYYCCRSKADARLIAAAPELLEALEDLLEAVPKQTSDSDWWPDELTHAVRAARAAIARAEAK